MTAPVRKQGFSMVAGDGGFWVAALGATVPTGLAAPGTGWTPGGAVSDDGFVYGVAESNTSWTPFGLTAPWRTEVTSSVRTMQFTSWEIHRPVVISLWDRVDASTITEDSTTHLVAYAETASPAPDRRMFIYDFLDGATVHRYFFPDGEVTDRGNVTNKQTEQMGYQMTVTAYPDSANNTVYHTFLTAARQSAMLA